MSKNNMTANRVVFNEVEIVEEKGRSCRPRKTIVSVNSFEQNYRRSLSPLRPSSSSSSSDQHHHHHHHYPRGRCRKSKPSSSSSSSTAGERRRRHQKGGQQRRTATLSPVPTRSHSDITPCSPKRRQCYDDACIPCARHDSNEDVDLVSPRTVYEPVRPSCLKGAGRSRSDPNVSVLVRAPPLICGGSSSSPIESRRSPLPPPSCAHLCIDKPPVHVSRQVSRDDIMNLFDDDSSPEQQPRGNKKMTMTSSSSLSPAGAAAKAAFSSSLVCPHFDKPPTHVCRQVSKDAVSAACDANTTAAAVVSASISASSSDANHGGNVEEGASSGGSSSTTTRCSKRPPSRRQFKTLHPDILEVGEDLAPSV